MECLQEGMLYARFFCLPRFCGALFSGLFPVSAEFLRRAELLSENNLSVMAVTMNNYACLYRKYSSKCNTHRTNKLRIALNYLEKALEIEYKGLLKTENNIEQKLVESNPCDIHLNICAILSLMGKHDLALQHAMKALILIQDELAARNVSAKQQPEEEESKQTRDRFTVLSIAYHNIAVEHEYLKQVWVSELTLAVPGGREGLQKGS